MREATATHRSIFSWSKYPSVCTCSKSLLSFARLHGNSFFLLLGIFHSFSIFPPIPGESNQRKHALVPLPLQCSFQKKKISEAFYSPEQSFFLSRLPHDFQYVERSLSPSHLRFDKLHYHLWLGFAPLPLFSQMDICFSFSHLLKP